MIRKKSFFHSWKAKAKPCHSLPGSKRLKLALSTRLSSGAHYCLQSRFEEPLRHDGSRRTEGGRLDSDFGGLESRAVQTDAVAVLLPERGALDEQAGQVRRDLAPEDNRLRVEYGRERVDGAIELGKNPLDPLLDAWPVAVEPHHQILDRIDAHPSGSQHLDQQAQRRPVVRFVGRKHGAELGRIAVDAHERHAIDDRT